MPNRDPEAIRAALKHAAGALRDAGIEFLLAGGMAVWARGGPASVHDLDFAVRPRDAEGALAALADAGLRPERPPEPWLYKAWTDDDVLVDVLFDPEGHPVDDAMFERAETLTVDAVPMCVMAAEDVLASKLLALREHNLDYDGVLMVARALREQVDWAVVRAQTSGSPFAAAFFTMVEELRIVDACDAAADGQPAGRRSSPSTTSGTESVR